MCYKTPPRNLEESIEDRHRKPDDHLRLGNRKIRMSDKSLDQADKQSKWRSWWSDLFEKLHWQKWGSKNAYAQIHRVDVHNNLDLESKQKEKSKMTLRFHFNAIVIFFIKHWTISTYKL